MGDFRALVDKLFPDDRRLQATLGWYEVVAGVVGLLFLLTTLLSDRLRIAHVALVLAAMLYFWLLTWAGILVLRNHPAGIRLSLYAQYFQVPQFATGVAAFSIYSPASLVLFIESSLDFGIQFEGGAGVGLAIGSMSAVSFLGVNVLALAIIFIIRFRILNEMLPSEVAARRRRLTGVRS